VSCSCGGADSIYDCNTTLVRYQSNNGRHRLVNNYMEIFVLDISSVDQVLMLLDTDRQNSATDDYLSRSTDTINE